MLSYLRRQSWKTPVLAVASLLCLTLGSGRLAAEPSTSEDKSAAREWALKGIEQYKVGDYASAATSLKNAESLFHATTHLLYLARCQEKLGNLADARELYLALSHEQVDSSAGAALHDAQEAATTELAALEPRVPYVTLQLEGTVPDSLSITDNGRPLPAATVGIRRPVNPGEHRFAAQGDGVGGEQAVTIGESENVTVTLKLGPRATPSTPAPATSQPKVTSSEGEHGGPRTMLYAGIGVGAVGVVGLVTGSVFLVSAGSKQTDRDNAAKDCSTVDGARWCTAAQANTIDGLQNDEQSARTTAGWAFAIGGVALAAGGTLIVLDILDHQSSTETGRRVVPYVGYRSAGVVGTF
jgi:hypothetical protein